MNTQRLISLAMTELGKRGGKARVEGMTAKQRKESAKKAAEARWAGHTKKAGK